MERKLQLSTLDMFAACFCGGQRASLSQKACRFIDLMGELVTMMVCGESVGSHRVLMVLTGRGLNRIRLQISCRRALVLVWSICLSISTSLYNHVNGKVITTVRPLLDSQEHACAVHGFRNPMSTNPFRRSSLKSPGTSSPLNIPSADTHGSSPGPLSVDTKGK